MNRIPVGEEHQEEFEKAFATRDRAVDHMPGFIDLQVLRPNEGRTYIVMTRWQSLEDFKRWTESPEFISAHRKQSPGLSESRPTLEIYEILAA